jgi:hypothetical protein
MFPVHRARLATPWVLAFAASFVGCGAKTGLIVPDRDAASRPDRVLACMPVDDACTTREVCGNGLDDDCNGAVDEGCACAPGSVQSCFAGPPGRRNVGVCRDGEQTCDSNGTWGQCMGGVLPHQESSCNGADNLCTGCSRDEHCPITCPAPGDVRVPDGTPFQPYSLRGRDFFQGAVQRWQWHVQGGPCDAISPRPSFELDGDANETATLLPRLSGDYTVTLEVVTSDGETLRCTFVVHVAGPGVRIEMCYPESTYRDLDLYVHRPGNNGPWFDPGTTNCYSASADACSWHNCEAHLRSYVGTTSLPRADWGYAESSLSECEHGPYGREWQQLGFCANPRLDLDNNLLEGIGVPENVNIDDPHDGDRFRVMVQNFTGPIARPLVNVYCGGRRVATFGEPGDEVPRFHGDPGSVSFGAMWRVADVTAHVDASGATVGCDVIPIHAPGATSGYYVTQNDPSF